MSYDKLKSFVVEQKNVGVAERNIRAALTEKGWNNDLIDKAIFETFGEKKSEQDSLTVRGIFKNTWNNFVQNLSNYLLVSLIAACLPILPIIIFAAPVVYDIAVLNLELHDFTSGPMLPLMVVYLVVALVIAIIIALWGNLSIMTLAGTEGELGISESFRKSWKSLTGYIWISFLGFMITTALFLPTIILILVTSLKLIPGAISYVVLGSAFLLAIPALLASILFIFAPFAYIIHGAKGKTALRTSYNLVSHNFKFVFVRLFALWVALLIISIVLGAIPVVGGLIKIATTPLMIIYITKLYNTTHKMNSESQD